MNKKAGSILKYSLIGVLISLILLTLGVSFVYAKANLDAKSEINSALGVVDQYQQKGLSNLDYKKSKLTADRDSLNTFLSYNNLKDLQNYAKETQDGVRSTYNEEVGQKKKLFQLDLEAFSKDLADTESIKIENRSNFETKEQEFAQKLLSDYASLTDLQNDLSSLEETHKSLLAEVDSSQKQTLKDNIENLKKEADDLIAFFKKRAGYTEEIRKVQEYKSKSNDLVTLEKYKTYSFNELNKVFEEQVYPLFGGPKEKMSKISTEEKARRQSLVDAETAKWQGLGKTPPPAPFANEYKQIHVNIATQYLYAYEDGELVLSTPITSGMIGHETVKGKFAIYSKERQRHLRSPFPNIKYDLVVDYWLPFYSGYGIHDSCNSTNCWRRVFGGQDYLYHGSHGCVNTPYDKVAILYNWAEIGTTVYID